jgi:hypothetical protein
LHSLLQNLNVKLMCALSLNNLLLPFPHLRLDFCCCFVSSHLVLFFKAGFLCVALAIPGLTL